VDALIHAFKYHGNLALARVLGAALAGAIDDDVDFIVPMPLSLARLRDRGFNQALEIARYAGAAKKIPVLPTACRRVLDTPSQAALPWKERARNVRGAFVCDADLTDKRVAIVDDVMTTGSTLAELAKKLKRAGASRVSGWVVARALPRSRGF
jgi:ComF family protein